LLLFAFFKSLLFTFFSKFNFSFAFFLISVLILFLLSLKFYSKLVPDLDQIDDLILKEI
jgi:hypothetical protein